MKTIFKPAPYKIIELFYNNKNQPLYLREISRKIKLNESSVSRHLTNLLNENILDAKKDGNLKKFTLNKSKISFIFSIYDVEKLERFPLLRKNAIKEYIKHLNKKPLFLIIFGSTAKETFRKDSDLDILEVYYEKVNNEESLKYVEAQTGIRMQKIQLTEKQFKKELKEKKDKVIQSALNTGFPVFNKEYYYEVIYNE